MAAAREAGVSRTTGNNWSRGYETYCRGQVTGFVPALERLAVRQISARFLSQDERIEIADLRLAGLSIRQIADSWAGRRRRSRVSCAATPRAAPVTGRSRPTAGQPRAGAAVTGGGSRPTASWGSWSPNCWRSGGARSRSAGTCG
jgi:transposase, IS30 family